MASLKRQITEPEKQRVLDHQRRNGTLFCFAEGHPIDDEGEVEFHHIKPFSEDGPSAPGDIGAVCENHDRRIRTLSLSEFRDLLAMDAFFSSPEPRWLDDLLRLWKRIPEALRQRGICRTSNVVSDVAERLVAESLGLTLSANSTRGYDLTSASGERCKIKSRPLTDWNDSRQLSDTHHLRPSDPFEFLNAVFFREGFPRPFAVFGIPVAIVHQFVRKKVRRHVLIANGPILDAPGVEDITSKMTA